MGARLASLAVGAVISAACHDATAPPPPPPPVVSLYYLKAPTNSGDGQTDTVFATLPCACRVLVRRGGTPAQDLAVLWGAGGGSWTGIPYVSALKAGDANGSGTSPFNLA